MEGDAWGGTALLFHIEQLIVGFVTIDLLQTPPSLVQFKQSGHSLEAGGICTVWNLGGQRSAKP